jgi:predicted O-methyltransferase YrrM
MTRIEAIYTPGIGMLGCSLSHCKALELALTHPEWTWTLILEDDIKFIDNPWTEIKEALNNTNPDVLMLARGFSQVVIPAHPISNNLYRVHTACVAAGYIVHRNYITKLLRNIRESIEAYTKPGGNIYDHPLDVYWYSIQKTDNWYAFDRSIVIQPNIFTSDILCDSQETSFTIDWFSKHIPKWERLLNKYVDTAARFLELGCFQGMATTWMVDKILTHPDAKITCVDTFEGSPEHQPNLRENLWNIFHSKTKKYGSKVQVYKGYTSTILKTLSESYDFIYVNADHRASSVLEDAVLAFRRLKVGGFLCFDDYKSSMVPREVDHPKIAIDAFIKIYLDYIGIVDVDYQYWIVKTAELP